MIPKIIHYCWFGSQPMPAKEQQCVDSWHIFFPDYKFMFWNEETLRMHHSLRNRRLK